MNKTPLIDCQNLIFSYQLAENRINQAQKIFGIVVVQRLLCFALYLLGLTRKAIGQSLEIPSETAKSIIKAINRNGLSALEDRRRRFSTFLPKALPELPPITLREKGDNIIVSFGMGNRYLKLSRHQKQDYRVTAEVKAELIQQFAVDVITSGRTSSKTISAVLKKRCDIDLPDRTIRHHVARMGLGKIKRSLPKLVDAVKKTSNDCSKT
ncbi:MAG: hypothetical protein B6I30_07510 [Desulfobacteraceae bacterium 4572_187]|nr:MAG: hypothetical protein B6I30_07510 [Desulfobacteraceae bacterium 4572_187]